MFWNNKQEQADAQTWVKRLDDGRQDDPTLAVAARLAHITPEKPQLNPFFKARLRRRLLAEHDTLATAARARRLSHVNRLLTLPWWGWTLAALLLLGWYGWHKFGANPVSTSPIDDWRFSRSNAFMAQLGAFMAQGAPTKWLPLLALTTIALSIILGISFILLLWSQWLHYRQSERGAAVQIAALARRGLRFSGALSIPTVALLLYIGLGHGNVRQTASTAPVSPLIGQPLSRVGPTAVPLAASHNDLPNAASVPSREVADSAPALAVASETVASSELNEQQADAVAPASASANTLYPPNIVAATAAPVAVGVVAPDMSNSASSSTLTPASATTIGLATGGAKDINNFRENIAQGYLPLPSDVTVEGLFYDYYFNTGQQQPCNQLFCPSYSQATSRDPVSGQAEHFLAVGLNSGIRAEDFARKRLNLVVVLDISGSMSEKFTSYYYDNANAARAQQWNDQPKLAVATQAITALINHLQPTDQLGIVLFDDRAYTAKPLRLVGETDIASIKRHVMALQVQGGTNIEAGYRMASELLAPTVGVDPALYENRILFLTDAQPNTGELGQDTLFKLVQANANQRIYTTFIGIGVDFNSTLIEGLTKTRGANYYAVHSPLAFVQRMDDEFDFMVTPLLFDLTLTFNSPDYQIAKVYGSSEADIASGELMRINTLFPSASRGGATKGGLVLLQLQPRNGNAAAGGAATLTVTYANRSGNLQSNVAAITLPPTSDADQWQDRYDNDGIRKGILLVRYANLLRNWINDSRASVGGLDDWRYPSVTVERGIVIPATPNLGPWERQSLPLQVSSEYRMLFDQFRSYFATEMAAVGDETLTQELTILDRLRTQ